MNPGSREHLVKVMSGMNDVFALAVSVTETAADRVEIVYGEEADGFTVHVTFNENDKAKVTFVRAGESIRRRVPTDGVRDYPERSLTVPLLDPSRWAQVSARLVNECIHLGAPLLNADEPKSGLNR